MTRPGTWWERGCGGDWYFHCRRRCLGMVSKDGREWSGFVFGTNFRRIGPWKTMKAAMAALEKEAARW